MFVINTRLVRSFERAMDDTTSVVQSEVLSHNPWTEWPVTFASCRENKYRSNHEHFVVTQVVVDEANQCSRPRLLDRDVWLPGNWYTHETLRYVRILWMLEKNGEYGYLAEADLAEEADAIYEVASQRSYVDEYGECLPLNT
jgi:hypothetical protein